MGFAGPILRCLQEKHIPAQASVFIQEDMAVCHDVSSHNGFMTGRDYAQPVVEAGVSC